MTLEELRAYFKKDTFAMAQGIVIESATETGARCSLTLNERQKNALGYAQGGLLYTLADFAFAVAANTAGTPTVTLNSTVHYLKPAAKGKITATASLKSKTRTICVYEVQLTDENATPLALATMTGYATGQNK